MSYTARPPFTGGMSNQNQQQQQSGQQNNANLGASGIPNMPIMNNAASSKNLSSVKYKICHLNCDSVEISPIKAILLTHALFFFLFSLKSKNN